MDRGSADPGSIDLASSQPRHRHRDRLRLPVPVPLLIAIAAVAAVAFLMFSQQAIAQDAQEAKMRFDKGAALFEAGDYVGAMVEFQASYDAQPDYRLRYNMGVCLYSLHRYVEAKKELQAYLSEGGGAITAEEKQEVFALLMEISTSIGTILLNCSAQGAVLSLDGVQVGYLPLTDPLEVDLGEHILAIFAPGFLPWSQKVSVAGGKIVTVTPALAQSGQPAPPPYQPSPQPPTPTPAPGPGVVPIGTSQGLLEVEAVIGNKYSFDYSTYQSSSYPVRGFSYARYKYDKFGSLRTRNAVLAAVSLPLFGGLGVLLGFLVFTSDPDNVVGITPLGESPGTVAIIVIFAACAVLSTAMSAASAAKWGRLQRLLYPLAFGQQTTAGGKILASMRLTPLMSSDMRSGGLALAFQF